MPVGVWAASQLWIREAARSGLETRIAMQGVSLYADEKRTAFLELQSAIRDASDRTELSYEIPA
jgi:hypothetical protein